MSVCQSLELYVPKLLHTQKELQREVRGCTYNNQSVGLEDLRSDCEYWLRHIFSYGRKIKIYNEEIDVHSNR